MDISQLIEDLKQLFIMYVQPYIGTIIKVAVAIIITVILLRILLPIIWENILVGIVKISDRKDKNKNEKED